MRRGWLACALVLALAGCADGPAGNGATTSTAQAPGQVVEFAVPSWQPGDSWTGRIDLADGTNVTLEGRVERFEDVTLAGRTHDAARITETARGVAAGGNRSAEVVQWFDRTSGAMLKQTTTVVERRADGTGSHTVTRIEFDRPCPQLWGAHETGVAWSWTCPYRSTTDANGVPGMPKRRDLAFTATVTGERRATDVGEGYVVQQSQQGTSTQSVTYVLVPELCTPALIDRPGERRVITGTTC